MKRYLSTILFLMVTGILVLVITFIADKSGGNPPQPTTSIPQETINNNSSGGNTYTLAQVSQHANAASCWTAINGEVYDVTSFISSHPGGAGAILGLCGKDGSSAFDDQHGGQRRPANELAGLKIGTLKK